MATVGEGNLPGERFNASSIRTIAFHYACISNRETGLIMRPIGELRPLPTQLEVSPGATTVFEE